MRGERFWLSWVQPTEDYRPLTDPPVAGVLGWWCSATDNDGHAILCALVNARTLTAAKALLRASWPEVPSNRAVWRVQNEYGPSWLPSDRFPLAPWMRERIDRTEARA